jgi:site-specific DNA-cytosine methylase
LQDVESGPALSPAGGGNQEEEMQEEEEHVLSQDEEEEDEPNRSQRRRSNRISQLSQPTLNEDLLGAAGIDSDGDGDNNRAAAIPPTQLLQPVLPLCPAPAYKSNSLLKQQKEWDVKPVGLAIPASATPFGQCPGASNFTFYRSFSMLRDEDGDARVTHTVGDTVLMTWNRNDPKEDESTKDLAVCRIMAIFMKNEVLRFVPQWGRSWSDVVNAYSDLDTVEPDDEIRKSREIFWEAEVGAWPNVASKPLVERGLDPGEIQEAYNTACKCTVRHIDEFDSEEELEEFLAEPNTYFYRYSLPHAGPLRFEELPCPGTANPAEKKRLSAPLRMVDTFCGSGAVSLSATEIGWTVTFGVESNLKAFKTYCRNAPHAAKRNYRIQEFLRLVKAGTNPEIPKKGEVDWLHLSPPCQSLCSQNAHKGIDRYTEELIPLLNCIRELIMELECPFITIEEVPRFLYAGMPKVQFTKRKKAVAAVAAAAGETVAAGNTSNGDDEEIEVETDNAKEAEAEINDGSERVGVRAWLHIVPALLTSDWQVDMRVLNAAHYGCPQERPRLFLFAARRGYELPSPPEPMYFSKLTHNCFKRDDKLATIADWNCLTVHSDSSLPPAVTVLEAIDDLPRLMEVEEGAEMASQQDPRGKEGVEGAYYNRSPQRTSRYVLYMRQGADAFFSDHVRLMRTIGKQVDVNKPFSTIIGQDDKWSRQIHYQEWRALTVLERRRGQSFPDRMQLAGSTFDQMKIVGNAVPYLLARAVAAAVMVAATGNPSSAPELPNLKGWVDAEGNETSPPPRSEYCNASGSGAATSKKMGAKKRKLNPITANVDGTAEQESEEELSEAEEEEEEDNSLDAEKDEEEYEEPEEEEEERRKIRKKSPPPRQRHLGPISPEDKVEVRSFAGKKMTPMKMQKINTFFVNSPERAAAEPVEEEEEEEEEPLSQEEQRQLRELEQQRQREERQLLREKQRQQKEEEEVEQEVALDDDNASIKDEPAEPAEPAAFGEFDQDSGFDYNSIQSNDEDDDTEDDSSGQSSGGVAVVGGNSGGGCEIIDLTMDTDDD